MNTVNSIPITRTASSRLDQFDPANISFGKNPTDHVFLAEYKDGAWHNARIEPFSNLVLSPLALCLHYGQTVFEGFKAYRMTNDKVSIFRPDKHHRRMNQSLERMCMPSIPQDLFMEATHSLIDLERDWVPDHPNSSLYIRPFVIATEPRLGVKVSDEYLFMIVCMPMGSYYASNLKVKVETEYVRAVEGGTGAAKCGGNYGAAFYPTQKANEQGFDQVLWTDGKHNEFIEESGTMNIVFIIDGILITPPLSGSILDGVTRDSLISLAKDAGMKVEARPISYKELEEAFRTGKRVEAFGVGTAAVVSPIELIDIQGQQYRPDVSENAQLFTLKKQLQNIRTGLANDTHSWNYIL